MAKIQAIFELDDRVTKALKKINAGLEKTEKYLNNLEKSFERLDKITAKPRVILDDKKFKSQYKKVMRQLSKLDSKSFSVRLKLEDRKVLQQIKNVAKKIKQLEGKNSTIDLKANSSDAEKEIKELIKLLDMLEKKDTSVKITINQSKFQSALKEIKADLEQLERTEIKVKVSLDDRATGNLTTLTSALNRIDGSNYSPIVNIDNRATVVIGEINHQLQQLEGESAVAKVDVDTSKAESKLDGILAKMNEVSKGIAVATGATVTGGVIAGVPFAGQAVNSSTSYSKVSAVTGMPYEQVKSGTENVYYNQKAGNSKEEVTQSIGNWTQQTDLSDKEVEKAAAASNKLAQLMGADVNEVDRAMTAMIKNLGGNANDAGNVLAYIFKNSGDSYNDLLDTFNEYSPNFKEMGITGEEAAAAFVTGMKKGGRNYDDFADMFREFNIRSSELSKSQKEAWSGVFDGSNKKAEAFMNKVNGGEISGQAALVKVAKHLSTIKDKNERAAIASELLGSKYEDIGPLVLDMASGLDKTVKTTGELNKQHDTMRKNNPYQSMLDAQRNIEKVTGQMGETIMNKLAPVAEEFNTWIVSEEGKKSIETFAGIITDVLETVINVGKKIGGWVSDHPEATKWILGIGAGIAAASVLATALVVGFGGMAIAAYGVVAALKPMLGMLGKIGRFFDLPGFNKKSKGSDSTRSGRKNGRPKGENPYIRRFEESKEKKRVNKKMSPIEKHLAKVGETGKYTPFENTRSGRNNGKVPGKLSTVLKGAKGLSKAVPLVGTILAATTLLPAVLQKSDGTNKGNAAKGKAIGDASGMLAGGAAGAAIGTMIFPGVGTIIGGIVGSIAGGKLGSIIGEKIGEGWNSIKKTSAEAGKNVANYFRGAWDHGIEFWKNAGTWFMDSVWNPLMKNGKDAWDGITGYFSNAWDTGIAFWKGAGAWFVDNVWEPIAGFASDYFDRVVAFWSDPIGSIGRAIEPIVSWITDNVWNPISNFASDSFDGIVEWATGLPGRIGKAISSNASAALSAVTNLGRDMLNGISGAVNGVTGGVNWVLGKIGVDAKIPAMPMYAKGTNNHPGGPAIVGEEGRELAHIPGKGKTVLGMNGPEMVNLPKGSSVLPNAQTEAMLSSDIPGYAGGVGDFFKGIGNKVVDGAKSIGGKVLNGATDIWNMISDPKALMSSIMSKFGVTLPDFGGVMGKMIPALFKQVKDAATGWMSNKSESADTAGYGKGMPSGGINGALGTLANLLANKYGLRITSTLRPGAMTSAGTLSDHATGKAVDMAGSYSGMWGAAQEASKNPIVKYAINRNLWSKAGGPWKTFPWGGHMDHTHISGYAKGGKINQNQMALVGEQGPELINLPGGSEVFSNKKSNSIAGTLNAAQTIGGTKGSNANAGLTVHLGDIVMPNVVVKEESDIVRIGQIAKDAMRDALQEVLNIGGEGIYD